MGGVQAMVMKRKNAQMKIQQMSFMLIAVFIFFALVGMMVLTVKMSELRTSATALKEQNAKLLVTKLANSPEFTCGGVYGSPKTDCIDEDKVMILKDNIDKYTTFWGATNIQIRRIYPKSNTDVECTNITYPKCNLITLINKPLTGFDYSNFVALCRKENYKDQIVSTCEMAKLIVRYEEATTKKLG
jgi:hypothetical protein